jgi:hypothetical protein
MELGALGQFGTERQRCLAWDQALRTRMVAPLVPGDGESSSTRHAGRLRRRCLAWKPALSAWPLLFHRKKYPAQERSSTADGGARTALA